MKEAGADRTAKRIKGVKAVAQEIEDEPSGGRNDEDIANAIFQAFRVREHLKKNGY